MAVQAATIVVYPGFQALDAVGPLEVLSTANWLAGGPDSRYTIELAAMEAGPVRSDSGLVVQADRALGDGAARPDLLVIAGGVGAHAAADDATFIAHVRSLAGASGRVAAICTGAFVLAQTGLLDARSATTHWHAVDRFAERFPAVELHPDRIFVDDAGFWTSAGVTAGIDLTLELVRLDHGEAVAAEVARHLVVYLQRTGGQNQYSSHLAAQQASHPTVRDIQTSIVEDPRADHSVAALAARAMLSERTFQRLFKRETGTTPGHYVERVRIDHARRLLESTTDGLAPIARSSGFGTLETFLRAFSRRLGVTPTQYRDRFRRETTNATG